MAELFGSTSEKWKDFWIFPLWHSVCVYIILYSISLPGNVQVNIPINADDDKAWHEGS